MNSRFRATVLVVFALLFLATPTLFAQSKVGTSAAPFLTIGVGARPQAMGGAFVAVSDDVHSLFWNPAGLAMMDRSEVMLVHSTWLADMAFDYVGGAIVMGQYGTLGASATLLSVGEMEVTTAQYQEGTGLMFNSYDLSAALSYGFQFYDRFAIGFNAKYIHQSIWNESAGGMAMDLGTLLITPLKDIRLGMSISNFGTKMQMSGRDLTIFHDPDENREGNNDQIPAKLETDEWKLPLTMRLGISGEAIETGTHRLTWAFDWVVPNDNTEAFNLGMEYGFNEFFFLRGGMRSMRPNTADGFELFEEDNGGGFTAGSGVRIGLAGGVGFHADFAFETFERLGNVYKYALSVTF